MRSKIKQILIFSALMVLLILTLLPFYMTILMSQKTNGEIVNNFWGWPQKLHLDYYLQAFRYILPYIINSLFVVTVSVVAIVFFSSLGGYVFGRMDFGGKKVLFTLIISLMMIPGILTLIPSFLWMREFPFWGGNNWLGLGGNGLLNSRLVLILPYISGGQIFGIFLCRTFFESLPESLFEAARLDGATELQTYFRIALPLSLPIVATLAIMSFVGIYNDYIWPLVTISSNNLQVFSVGVVNLSGEYQQIRPGVTMAGYLLGSIPLIILFSFGMKYYIEGLTKGAIKG
jgi:ABC-type glycerol-3-phosphate transport system permease component